MKQRHAGMMRLAVLSVLCATPAAMSSDSKPAFAQVLQRQFSQLQTVYLRARAIVAMPDPVYGDSAGRGTVEYWADGDRWRLNCTIARTVSTALAPDKEVAFDGETFQLLMKDSSVLSIQRGDPGGMIPTTLPNPLVLPLRFVVPNPFDARLSDLRKAEGWDSVEWRAEGAILKATSAPTGTWPLRQPRTAYMVRYNSPSRIPNGAFHREHSYQSFVEVGSDERLRRIEGRGASGELIESIDFDEYGAFGDFVFPRVMTMSAYGPGAEDEPPVAHVDIRVDTLRINEYIDPAIFSIDWGLAKTVWDSDAEEFVKTEEEN